MTSDLKSNPFKHKIPVQLRFKDGDVMGHVNNANHFTYFELARIHYFRDVVRKDINWNKEGIILARMVIDYKNPLLINDEVYAYTKCSRLGNKSFDLEYMLVAFKGNQETEIATGVSTLVCYNYEIKESVEIPDEWRKKLSAFDMIK